MFLKRLKIVLQSKYFYIGLLLITVVYSLFYFLMTPCSKISESDKDFVGIILNMEVEGDLLKLELEGKEKIIGNYFFSTLEEKNDFLKNYELGDKLYLTGTFSSPNNNTLPNLFNYKDYLKRQKIYYVMQIDEFEKLKDNNKLFYKIKNSILNHIDGYKNRGYLKTFILGDTNFLDSEVLTSYQENGISHLLAISGMHVSLLAGILLFILKKLKLNQIINYSITITFLFFYMVLSGSSSSISRSVILFSLLGIYKLLKIDISTIFILIFTFCILVIINPYILFEVGFQYSFIISFYLILMQKKLNNSSYLKSLVKISIISFLVSFPISIYYFYQINLFSILLNLIFVPLVSFIVFPLSLLTFLFPFLDSLFLVITNFMEYLSFCFYNISIFNIVWMKPSIWWIILYYIGLTIYLCSKKKLSLILIILLLCYQYFQLAFFSRTFLIAIDVGQGDSLLMHSDNQTILIDTGGKISYEKEKWQERNTKSLTDNTLLPLFKSLGIRKLDYLVLSHGDYDHMGEAINLVNNFKVEKVVFNCGPYNDLEKELIKVLDKKKIKYYSCIKELNIDKNKLQFLQTKEYDNENDNSNVIYTEIDGYKFMFMGDASSTTEKEILKKYNLQDIDILKVGHHGSKTSSSKEFINEINSKYSIISVGKNNKYGHPNKEVLDKLENSKIYRTDQDGSIMFKIKNNKLKIETCSP